MTPSQTNASERLRGEILAEAGRQRDAILRQAREKADAVIAKADQEAARLRAERLGAAELEAKRKTDALLATVPVAAGRGRAARIEEMLEVIRAQARQWLEARHGLDHREVLARLAAEAVGRMAGDTFRLRLSAADARAWGNGLAEAIQQQVQRGAVAVRLEPDARLEDGEAFLEDEAGRQVWNLNLVARLERCWPELRQQIARQTAITEDECP